MIENIPIGIDDFKEIIEGNHTYVDKTHFIEEVIDNTAKVQLILRPRRFGKSLNMSTLARFFDHSTDHRQLFKGLYIESRPCFEQCGSAPVIFLSFKEVTGQSYQLFLTSFRELIENLYRKHEALLNHLDESEARFFRLFRDGIDADEGQLMRALSRLMRLLEKVHGKAVVLLIDEYDAPIHEAYVKGYYDQAVSFMRTVLSSALKGHPSLRKAVLTGILRVSKESIFSGLNHVKVFSVMDPGYATSFGFTENEVVHLLTAAGYEAKASDVKHWYNGYLINGQTVYNPWSVLSFLYDKALSCGSYWLNTSSNDLIYKLFHNASLETQKHLAQFMDRQVIDVDIARHTSFRDFDGRALWTLLLYSGYLTRADDIPKNADQKIPLRIPNREVQLLYEQIFKEWFQKGMGQDGVPDMLRFLISGDIENFGKKLSELVQTVLSYYDTGGATPERIYHAFVLGLLSHLHGRYQVRSNRESGLGRYDVMMIPKDPAQPGFVFEFKAAETLDDLDAALEVGLEQIRAMNYRAELEAHGLASITEIAVAFCGKVVRLQVASG